MTKTETPETDALIANQPSEWDNLRDAAWSFNGLLEHARSLERRLSAVESAAQAGMTCEDEGCPHFGTPHDHPKQSAAQAPVVGDVAEKLAQIVNGRLYAEPLVGDICSEAVSHIEALSARVERLTRERDTWQNEARLANAHQSLDHLVARAEAAEQRADRLQAELDAAKAWLDSNTTFYDVVPDGPEACTAGPNIPVLASVSKRIWYHATDDQASHPFSAVIDAARTKESGDV